jgi:Holliday junction resolvase
VTGGAGPRRRGSSFERDIVAFLQAHGFPYAERSYGAGRPADVGDVDGLPGFVIDVVMTLESFTRLVADEVTS